MSHFKKSLVILICLTISVCSGYLNKAYSAEQVDKSKIEKENKVEKTDKNNVEKVDKANADKTKADKAKVDEKAAQEKMAKLLKDPRWQSLTQFWKQLNAMDPVKKADDQLITFNNLSLDKEKATTSLKELRNSGLISSEEKDALQYLIGQRFAYMQVKAGIILYNDDDKDKLGTKVVQKLDDLELKYDLLEKTFKESKPNQSVLKKTREQIVKNIEFIEDPKGENKFKPDNKIIDLLVNMNK